jgi:3',5'-cyclic AMP phosphodiesterase CpdA
MFVKGLAAATMAAGWSGTVRAQTGAAAKATATTRGVAADRSFAFVQLADTQLGFKAWSEDLTHEVAQFERAIAHVNRLQPSFVIISGDLVNSPRTEEKLSTFDRLRATIDPAIPVHVQPGNHDLGLTPTAESLATYRARYGRDFYSFRVGGTHFVNLNSQIIFVAAALPEETAAQWAWLKRDLAAARAEGVDHIVVLAHYPWFLEDPEEDPEGDPLFHKNRGYYMIPRATRREYLALLAEHDVRVTFSGHVHGNVYGRSGGMEMVTSGPVSVSLHEGTAEGLRIVRVTPGAITHAYHALDAVPATLAG